MKFASLEKMRELKELENEYFGLKGIRAIRETNRCILRGQLVEGFIGTEEKVNEAIRVITEKIEELKIQKEKESKKVEVKEKMPAGVVVAKFEGWDADTGERIHIGDWIVKTWQGWSKIENAF